METVLPITNYRYRGRGRLGQTLEGQVRASDPETAVTRLQQEGLLVISIQPQRRRLLMLDRLGWIMERVPSSERLVMLEAWAAFLEAGMPLQTALGRLKLTTSVPAFSRRLEGIQRAIDRGVHFSDALRLHRLLPPSWIRALEAAELTGDIPGILRVIIRQEKQMRRLKGELVSMLTMPLILMGLIGVWMWVFSTRVVPTVAQFLSLVGHRSALLELLQAGASTLAAVFPLTALCLGGLWFVSRYAHRGDEEMGPLLTWLSTRLPVVGRLIAGFQTVVLVCHLRTQVLAGVPLLEALEVIRRSVRNPQIRSQLYRAHRALSGGSDMGTAFSNLTCLSPLARSLIPMDQHAGNLPELLEVVERESEADWLTEGKRLQLILRSFVIGMAGLLTGLMVAAFFTVLFSALGASVSTLAL